MARHVGTDAAVHFLEYLLGSRPPPLGCRPPPRVSPALPGARRARPLRLSRPSSGGRSRSSRAAPSTSGAESSREPSGIRSRIVYWTASTFATRSCATTKSSIAPSSAALVQGVKGSHEGRTSIPWRRSKATAALSSAAVCPLSKMRRVVSSTDSKADTTNRQPAFAKPAQRSSWARMCSTLVVQSKLRSGKRGMDRLGDPHGVPGPVEEVRVGKGHMLCAHRHELGHVAHDDLFGHDAKAAVVHDRRAGSA